MSRTFARLRPTPGSLFWFSGDRIKELPASLGIRNPFILSAPTGGPPFAEFGKGVFNALSKVRFSSPHSPQAARRKRDGFLPHLDWLVQLAVKFVVACIPPLVATCHDVGSGTGILDAYPAPHRR